MISVRYRVLHGRGHVKTGRQQAGESDEGGLDQGSYWSQARAADDGVEWQMALVVSGGKCSLLPTSLVVLFFWDA